MVPHLFAFRGPMHLACRVLDVVLVEGAQMMLRFALTLMFRNQEAILELDDFESLIHFLNNAVYDDYKVFTSTRIHIISYI